MTQLGTKPVVPPIPPLEQGDQLTRDEFERRYTAMPQVKKAELLEGMVHLPSPVRLKRHARPHASLIGWLVTYAAYTPGTIPGDNGTVRLDLDNEPQPDGTLIIEPACGGAVVLSEDDYIEGVPEWVGEVSTSSVSIDLGSKLHVYRRNQVREYLVWRVQDSAIDWFTLRQSQYEQLPLGSDGIYRSEVFPGLWLDPEALVRMEMPRVLEVLQQGLASPEHTAFVERLKAGGGK